MLVCEKEFLLDCHRTSGWPQGSVGHTGRDSQFSNSVKASFCLLLRETFESRLLIVSDLVDGVAVAPPVAVRCVVLARQLSAAHALISNGSHVVKNAPFHLISSLRLPVLAHYIVEHS